MSEEKDSSENKIKDLSGISKLQNLKTLNLSRNKLEKIHREIYELRNLSSLNVSFNKISEIPRQVKRLKKLKSINLSNNKNCSIKNIKFIERLDTIILNRMGFLKMDIPFIKKIKCIYLCGNNLTTIDKKILSINLRELNISQNNINRIDRETMIYLKTIKHLMMYEINCGSPVLVYPDEEDIADFLEQKYIECAVLERSDINDLFI